MAKFLLIASAAVAVSASKFSSAPTRCDPTLLVPIEDALAPQAFVAAAPCDNTPTRHCSAPHRINPTPCTRAITIADEECCDEEHSPVEHCEDSCSCGGKKTLHTSCCGCSCSSNDDGCCTTSCSVKNCCESNSDNCDSSESDCCGNCCGKSASDSCEEKEIIHAICDGTKVCPAPVCENPIEFPCHAMDDCELTHRCESRDRKKLCKVIRRAPLCRDIRREACEFQQRCGATIPARTTAYSGCANQCAAQGAVNRAKIDSIPCDEFRQCDPACTGAEQAADNWKTVPRGKGGKKDSRKLRGSRRGRAQRANQNPYAALG